MFEICKIDECPFCAEKNEIEIEILSNYTANESLRKSLQIILIYFALYFQFYIRSSELMFFLLYLA